MEEVSVSNLSATAVAPADDSTFMNVRKFFLQRGGQGGEELV